MHVPNILRCIVRHNLTSLNIASCLCLTSLYHPTFEVLTAVLKILVFRELRRWVLPDVSNDRSAVIFRVPVLESLTLKMHNDPQKRMELLTKDIE
jgi:hypothetical protein